jgi:DNA-binding SARP family transcriptional activator
MSIQPARPPAMPESGSAGRDMVNAGGRSVVGAKVRMPMPRSLARDRLHALMRRLWPCRLGLVVAPAGWGKTTLLASLAASADVPVGWYCAESWDGSTEAFLRHLEAALAPSLPGVRRGWFSVEDVVDALEAYPGTSALMVIDDLHTLEGSPGERAFGRLLSYAPDWLVFVAASRRHPRLDMSRLRVSNRLLEISVDDLRFRSWEVERLFIDFYSEPLPPAELAQLARRTEGWAAGLQLFHLATSGKPPDERRRVLAGLATASRFVREYLTSDVLDELPNELRRFLVSTSVLGRLSGAICDRFLGRDDSDHLLQELERRQVFTHALEGGGEYRYHEVFRSHLEGVLLLDVGEERMRQLHQRAGSVLEALGALPEALHAYCRAEDRPAASRLLAASGAKLVQGSGAWIDALPSGLVQQDPWLLLAGARRHLMEGAWCAAVERFRLAELAFGGSEGSELARRERQSIGAWLNHGPAPRGELLGVLRAATVRIPPAETLAATCARPAATLVGGLTALLAGDMNVARRELSEDAIGSEAGRVLALSASLAFGIAGLLAGEHASARGITQAVERAELLEIGFLARLGRASLALGRDPQGLAEAVAVRYSCSRLGDEWGAALAGLFEGYARATAEPPGNLEEAARLLIEVSASFQRMNAPVLETWSRSLLAVARARARGPDATTIALQAERQAQSRGVIGGALMAYLALAIAEPNRRGEYSGLVAAIRATSGLSAPSLSVDKESPSVAIRVFGGFEFSQNGVIVDLSGIKPRARALLRLLAMRGGRPLHREAIVDFLWPEAGAEAGAHNLHVALSCLRHTLGASAARGATAVVMRDGDAYRLVLPEDAEWDIVAFETDIAAARRTRAAGDVGRAIKHSRQALDRYSGELLPEDGAAEWVVEPRDQCRVAAAEAACALAELLLEVGDADGSAKACAAGLSIDRYHDPLWRLQIIARERAGDRVAASRARAGYERLLVEVGLATGTVAAVN